MRISDWSSDVCSSDLKPAPPYTRCAICPAPGPYLSLRLAADFATDKGRRNNAKAIMTNPRAHAQDSKIATPHRIRAKLKRFFGPWGMFVRGFIKHPVRSEEHTSELQSLMRISYAVFCLKKKKTNKPKHNTQHNQQQLP